MIPRRAFPSSAALRRAMLCLAGGLLLLVPALAVASVERFPPPDFGAGYAYPLSTQSPARAGWLFWLDTGVLVLALSAASWIALRSRSRRAMFYLSAASLAYFGFYRKGCVCPIGAIQNVALALGDPTYLPSYPVLLFFVLPLLFAVFFGRAFCAGVCPLGAVQDLTLIRAVRVPRPLDTALSVFRFVYLGLAVLLAFFGARFLICEYDPFVGFFRFSARFSLWIWSGIVLGIGLFIGRPYCRYLCPYGALLSLFSRFSVRRVTITPSECIRCGLCRDACAFNAIHPADAGSGEPSA